MKLLITGATGFIGTHLVEKLYKEHDVHILIPPSLTYSLPGNVEAFEFSDNISALHRYLQENNIEGIVHLASLFIAQHQPEQIKDMILSNVYLGTAVLEAMEKTEVKWVLNTGTYWQNYKHDKKEYCPVNLYAASKQAFIDMAAYYVETSDVKFVTLKLSDTFGRGDTRRKILAVFKEIAASGEELCMSTGEQYIDILHIDDVISGFVHLMHLLHTNTTLNPEYVLAAKQRYTLKQIAAIYEKVSRKKLNIVWGGRAYRKREVMIPWTKGTVLPGWEPAFTLEQGITEFINEKQQSL